MSITVLSHYRSIIIKPKHNNRNDTPPSYLINEQEVSLFPRSENYGRKRDKRFRPGRSVSYWIGMMWKKAMLSAQHLSSCSIVVHEVNDLFNRSLLVTAQGALGLPQLPPLFAIHLLQADHVHTSYQVLLHDKCFVIREQLQPTINDLTTVSQLFKLVALLLCLFGRQAPCLDIQLLDLSL